MNREATALIVIDMQNGFCRDEGSIPRIGFDIGMAKAAILPCARLLAAARDAGLPVIFTRYVYQPGHTDGGLLVDALMPELKAVDALVAGTWDMAIIDELSPREGEIVIDKNRPSAFFGTNLDEIIANHGIRELIVCGVTTNCCVETTVRDASQRDILCHVAADATGELDRERHDAALRTMGILFARVTDTATIEAALA
jgi:ureidoacrylate peracid hydrolase